MFTCFLFFYFAHHITFCPLCDCHQRHVSRTSENSTLGDGLQDVPGANCWPLSGFSEMRQGSDRETGCLEPGCSGFISIVKEATVISNKDGSVAWQLSQAKAGTVLELRIYKFMYIYIQCIYILICFSVQFCSHLFLSE